MPTKVRLIETLQWFKKWNVMVSQPPLPTKQGINTCHSKSEIKQILNLHVYNACGNCRNVALVKIIPILPEKIENRKLSH